jgi:PEP-CTERM motif
MIRQLRFAMFALASFLATPGIQAQVVYMNESLVPTNPNHEIFNNNIGGETEDNWIANSFVVVSGGTRLQSISFLLAAALTNKQVTVAIYTGSSLTNPKAGTGLSRIVASTNTVSLSAAAFTAQTIPLASPVDLAVGQDFYAALLMPGVVGGFHPFTSDAGLTPSVAPLGHSFFDVGPTISAAYNLDVTTNATVLGGNHPVVGVEQSAGNLALRVNAVPEPSSLILTTFGLGLLTCKLLKSRRPDPNWAFADRPRCETKCWRITHARPLDG